MKAAVQDVYGSPDLLEVRGIDPPTVGPHEVLARAESGARS